MSLNLVNYSDSSSEEEVEERIAKPPIKWYVDTIDFDIK